MGSVSIYVSPVPPKEFSKKKRTSRVAKLKQCKLDVRREQWLSQVRTDEFKPETNEKARSSSTIFKKSQHNKTMDSKNKPIISTNEYKDMPLSLHDGSLKCLLSSTNPDELSFSEEACSPPQLTSSGSSSSDSSCWSISFSETDDDCLDDWEAMADALTLLTPHEYKLLENPHPKNDITPQGQDLQKPSTMKEPKNATTCKPSITRQAWSANDSLRPHSLPNLLNKIDLSKGSSSDIGGGNITDQLALCPICCEDLDLTDSSFQPCTCGFRLCLFCHNRILEADSRCPGCRKNYILLE